VYRLSLNVPLGDMKDNRSHFLPQCRFEELSEDSYIVSNDKDIDTSLPLSLAGAALSAFSCSFFSAIYLFMPGLQPIPSSLKQKPPH